MKFPEYFTEECFREESKAILDKKIDALLRTMTPEEKADLCHGHVNPPNPGQIGNGGYLPGVPRLGVPEIRMYDGPAGVTSVYETTGLPAEEMLASTWSRELAYEFGEVTGSENRMISGNCQLGAELDLVRTTHFNRTRDMLGEDPFLTGELGAFLVKGIQDQHVMAVLKHFTGYVVSANPADTPDMIIDDRTLHELYMPPFEQAIHGSDAAGVMTAYSRINGPYAANAEPLLKGVLRNEWNFDGLIMCDWGGNHSFSLPKGMDMEMPVGAYNSTERILKFLESGRLDIADLTEAARHVLCAMGKVGYLSLVEIGPDGLACAETGRTEPIHIPDLYVSSEELRKENAGTAQRIVEKGAVLLKNDKNALPIPVEDLAENTTAVIGMGAVYPVCGYGQERSYGTLQYMKSLGEELERVSGHPVMKEIGIDLAGVVIPTEMLSVDEDGHEKGLFRFYGITEDDGFRPAPMSMGGEGVEFIGVAERDEEEDEEGSLDFMPEELFNPGSDAADMDGHETGTLAGIDARLEFTCKSRTWKNGPDGTAFPKGTAYTWKGYLFAPEDGVYQINLQAVGGIAVCKMKLDDGEWRDIGNIRLREGTQWPWGNLVCTPEGMEICAVRLNLKGGKRYPVMVYGRAMLEKKDLQVRLAWVTPSMRKTNLANAVSAASRAKTVVLTVHKGFRMDHERFMSGMQFFDEMNLDLEKEQEELLLAVSKAVHQHGGKLVITAFNGSAFTMESWIDRTDALLWMWMPGQSGCSALARLLTGDAVPCGKLPQSFPAKNEDTPVSDTPEHVKERYIGISVPGKPSRVETSEGVFTGYRWYDKTGIRPLFPFGFGLSYTEYTYSNMKLSPGTDEKTAFSVELDITNSGNYEGDEIVQVYLGGGRGPAGLDTPEKKLCAFTRVSGLKPGETRHETLPVPVKSLMVYAPENGVLWQRMEGPFRVMAGASSEDIRLEETWDGTDR